MKTKDSSTFVKDGQNVFDLDGKLLMTTSEVVSNPHIITTYSDKPGFYKDSRNGVFRFNEYHRTFSEVIINSSEYVAEGRFVKPAIGIHTEYYAALHRDAAADHVNKLEDLAINSARADMQRNISNALVTLGELPESLKYIAARISSILGVLKRELYGRKRPPRARSETDLAAWWMEYRYAVMPMIYDIQQWMQYYHTDRARLLREYEKAKPWPLASGRHTYSYSTQIYGGRLRYGRNPAVMYDVTGTLSVSVGLRYVAPKPTAFFLAGATPEFILPSAWDLVPFSWMVDWFINMSTFFKSLSWSLGDYEYIGGWKTFKYTGITRATPFLLRGEQPDESVSGDLQCAVNIKDRYPLYWMPTVRNPHFEVKFTAKRIVDLLALGTAIISGKDLHRRISHG